MNLKYDACQIRFVDIDVASRWEQSWCETGFCIVAGVAKI